MLGRSQNSSNILPRYNKPLIVPISMLRFSSWGKYITIDKVVNINTAKLSVHARTVLITVETKFLFRKYEKASFLGCSKLIGIVRYAMQEKNQSKKRIKRLLS